MPRQIGRATRLSDAEVVAKLELIEECFYDVSNNRDDIPPAGVAVLDRLDRTIGSHGTFRSKRVAAMFSIPRPTTLVTSSPETSPTSSPHKRRAAPNAASEVQRRAKRPRLSSPSPSPSRPEPEAATTHGAPELGAARAMCALADDARPSTPACVGGARRHQRRGGSRASTHARGSTTPPTPPSPPAALAATRARPSGSRPATPAPALQAPPQQQPAAPAAVDFTARMERWIQSRPRPLCDKRKATLRQLVPRMLSTDTLQRALKLIRALRSPAARARAPPGGATADDAALADAMHGDPTLDGHVARLKRLIGAEVRGKADSIQLQFQRHCNAAQSYTEYKAVQAVMSSTGNDVKQLFQDIWRAYGETLSFSGVEARINRWFPAWRIGLVLGFGALLLLAEASILRVPQSHRAVNDALCCVAEIFPELRGWSDGALSAVGGLAALREGRLTLGEAGPLLLEEEPDLSAFFTNGLNPFAPARGGLPSGAHDPSERSANAADGQTQSSSGSLVDMAGFGDDAALLPVALPPSYGGSTLSRPTESASFTDGSSDLTSDFGPFSDDTEPWLGRFDFNDDSLTTLFSDEELGLSFGVGGLGAGDVGQEAAADGDGRERAPLGPTGGSGAGATNA